MLEILFLIFIAAKNYAILVNTSKHYINYRHNTNVQLFYNLLIKNNFSSDEIVNLFIEDQIQDPRNLFKNRINLNIPVNYYKIKPTVYDLDTLYSILTLEHEKLKFLDKSDNLLIYLCGHGNINFLKLYNRYFLFKNDLMRAIKIASKRAGKILLMVDTCKAESLIDRNDLPDNLFVVTTSKIDELSYSIEIDSELGVSTVDQIPFIFYQMAEKYLNRSLVDLFNDMNKKELKSYITFSEKPFFKLSDFLVQNLDDQKSFVVEPYFLEK